MYDVGTLVLLEGGTDTVYVITRVYPRMLGEDEYDGESLMGSSFSHLRGSDLIKCIKQKFDTTDDAYDRAMKGI